MFSASSPLQATSLDDYIAQFVAAGGRINKCPPMPALGDTKPTTWRRTSDGERKAPMRADEIDAIPADLDAARARIPGKRDKESGRCPPMARKIAGMVMGGKSRNRVASELGIALSTVRRQLSVARRHGIAVPIADQRDHETERVVLAAVAAGNSYSTVGRMIGIDKTRVGQIVRRARAEAAAQEERHGR